ncbi:hypothetical protein BU25DRAFT_49710 [Macroventuria anomochaeta]|uniref:Uncharacterized protein n=1 Tax=Macroventuria anomochaeta TaxID=301207 RepID=A0ACB6RZS8_9PLEO|nr:uncharacterized protein BU25DRAFT_49710 [Macroventuria anomochaeta]KAF2627531.1 hypothetical protein BU25DRAFT_49710 [Macroventuria anomochaeta]
MIRCEKISPYHQGRVLLRALLFCNDASSRADNVLKPKRRTMRIKFDLTPISAHCMHMHCNVKNTKTRIEGLRHWMLCMVVPDLPQIYVLSLMQIIIEGMSISPLW